MVICFFTFANILVLILQEAAIFLTKVKDVSKTTTYLFSQSGESWMAIVLFKLENQF